MSNDYLSPTKTQARSGACVLCGAETGLQSSEYIACCMIIWHVYEDHRSEWIRITGNELPPEDPDPRNPSMRDIMERVN